MTGLSLPPGSVAVLADAVLKHRVGAAGGCADVGRRGDGWFPLEPGELALEPGLGCEDTPGARAAYEDYARDKCAGCPVPAECLELALRDEAKPGAGAHGVWGGTAPWERRAILRARRRGCRQLAGAGVARA